MKSQDIIDDAIEVNGRYMVSAPTNNFRNMKLTFGKHKGKTIADLINEEEYSYIVWLEENVNNVSVDKEVYEYCKNELFVDKIMHEAKMESEHGDWGCRD